MNDEAVCRTAPATPGLLIIIPTPNQKHTLQSRPFRTNQDHFALLKLSQSKISAVDITRISACKDLDFEQGLCQNAQVKRKSTRQGSPVDNRPSTN